MRTIRWANRPIGQSGASQSGAPWHVSAGELRLLSSDPDRSNNGDEHISARVTQGVVLTLAAMAASLFVACGSNSPSSPALPPASIPAVRSPTPVALSYVAAEPHDGLSSLRCEECRAVDVIAVIDAETLETSEGRMRLYGAFVAPQEQNCVDEAAERLRELAGPVVRVEAGAQETDSAGTPVRYIYTGSGDSIDELFISEGLARTSAFDGAHFPWLLLTAEKARRERSGCIWANFNRMFPQRTPKPAGSLN